MKYMRKIWWIGGVLIASTSQVLAAGDGFIYAFEAPVLINGKVADQQTPISFGDRILTGSRGSITIKLDGNVYRLGHRSRLTLPENTPNTSLSFFFGSLLAVFKHNSDKTIYTKTAVLGVRGTGAYLEIDNQQTYLCTCYGDIDFSDATDEKNVAHIHSLYHNAITFDHQERRIQGMQPLRNHTTAELADLETNASRQMPETCDPNNTQYNTLNIVSH